MRHRIFKDWVVRRPIKIVRDSSGSMAVEFAVIFPVLILVVLGSLELGRAFETRNEMSHALSQAVRVVNLDPDQTAADIATLMASYLDEFDADDLTITTSTTTISGTDYMDISASFPFDVLIPFSALTNLTLDVSTRAPLVGSTI